MRKLASECITKKPVMIRMKKDLVTPIKDQAIEEERSFNSMANRMLDWALKYWEHKADIDRVFDNREEPTT